MESQGNQLKNEKSAYLKQHQDNPVHWMPWGSPALKRAQKENKPIFLSVGYSTCHWCHVMAHESFEDKAIADLMNEHFVCIKVDREEYPDLDQYYQQACQAFNRNGGWPLSVFLLPDGRPYFVGTYFPPTSRYGLPAFNEVLLEMSRLYHQERPKTVETADKVSDAIKSGLPPLEKVEWAGFFPNPQAILTALDPYADKEWGGYGEPPKFPNLAFYEWGIEQILENVVTQEQAQHLIGTMEKMLLGAIVDHPRGGLHRYSTDRQWRVPHFEKMLYDQAGFLRVLAKMGLLHQSALVYDGLFMALDYLEKEMFAEQKYFFAAQDADSDGQEGLYFTFSQTEFEDALRVHPEFGNKLTVQIDKLKKWMGITEAGNFHSGLNVISLDPQYFKEYLSSAEEWELVRQARMALLEARKDRTPPATDTKGIASWNFMLIAALIDVIQYCPVDPIKLKAQNILKEALQGLYANFLIGDPSAMNIRHTTTQNESLPYLEDYVFFAEAQLRLYEISGEGVFKNNFRHIIEVIKKEFVQEERIFTRALKAEQSASYPNQQMSSFDLSFRSPASTLVSLIRRYAVLFSDQQILADSEKLIQSVKQQTLNNPLGSGEALRALSYPPEIYRKALIPRAWLQQSEWISFMKHFMHRFVFDYHQDKDERWEICSMTACELVGKGFKELQEKLQGPIKEK